AQAINAAGIEGYSATFDATNGLTISNSEGDVAADLTNIGLGTLSSSNYSATTTNNSFNIGVDGNPAKTITLRDGTYTADSLADEINQQLNNDSDLQG